MKPALVMVPILLGILAAASAYAYVSPKLPKFERVDYYTAGNVQHFAVIEHGPGQSATMVLNDVPGGKREVQLVFDTPDRGGSAVASPSTAEAFAAYALLAWFKKHKKSYGSRIGAVVDGHRLVALFQEHPADKGTPYPHPGVTLLEAA